MRSSTARRVALTAGAAIALGSAAVATADDARQPAAHGRHGQPLTAELRDAEGARVGRVVLWSRGGGKIGVAVRARNLTPGFHGFHVHAVGVCDPATTDPATGQPAPCVSAGGHFNPGSSAHGGHAGDMPPLYVNRDGTAELEFTTDLFLLRHLRDADGSAVIVHAGSDNLANVPARYHSHTPNASSTTFGPDAVTLATGDAGRRAACGVVRR